MSFCELLTRHNTVFRLVGVSFNRETVSRLRVGDMLEVVYEEGNPHDPFAIRVTTPKGEDVGFFPADLARRLRQEADTPPPPLQVVVTEERRFEATVVGVDVRAIPARSAAIPTG